MILKNGQLMDGHYQAGIEVRPLLAQYIRMTHCLL